jgi:DNA polymerase-1
MSDEMVDYCINDVAITEMLYKRFQHIVTDKQWAKALRCEHNIQALCKQMNLNGFKFDKEKALDYLNQIKNEMKDLEDEFRLAFPAKKVINKTLKYRTYVDSGKPLANLVKAMEEFPDHEIVNDSLICYHYVDFKPGSPKQRVERLNEAGWKPIEKTKTHSTLIREMNLASMGKIKNFDWDKAKTRLEKFNKYGWVCSETNLNTLPDTAPEGAHKLAEWLTLEGRRSSLEEWLGQYNETTGRIHGSFEGIGAWTGRLSHSKPNEANIPSVFYGDANTAVKRVKQKYDGELRSLWTVEKGHYLVGTDAEGIQLRLLAHFMESEDYRDYILKGKKEDQTDIHNMNRKALTLPHITRDMAKTFIYAFLLNAGKDKVASILECSISEGVSAVNSFLDNIDGLKELKKTKIPEYAKKGFFIGLDGRKVRVPDEHHTLAGMLQNGESTLMKHAANRWTVELDKLQIPYKLLTWPHDEWQTESCSTDKTLAEKIGEVQCEAIEWAGEELGLFCPMAGESNIGTNWKETH